MPEAASQAGLRHPSAHSKAKEKEKRETIVIVGLGWLSFWLSLKLLLIAALQFLDLKSGSHKVKVHGIKHALDGGVKVRLGESGVIKGNSHWRRADGSLSSGSFPGGLCWCLRQRRGRLGGPCRNRWTRNKQNKNLKAQYLPTLGIGPQQNSGPDRTVESWLSPALWAQGIASLLPGSLCKHPFPTGPHGVGLQRSEGWGFSWRQISTSCRPFSGHKSLLILIIPPFPLVIVTETVIDNETKAPVGVGQALAPLAEKRPSVSLSSRPCNKGPVFLDHRCSSWPPAVFFCSFAVREQGKNFDDFYLIGKFFFFFFPLSFPPPSPEGYTNWLCELWEEAAEKLTPGLCCFLEFRHHLTL